MNAAIRQRLSEFSKNAQLKEVITFLYRDHPQGASLENLKEMLYLHDDFNEQKLSPLVETEILLFSGDRYKVSPDARRILDRDPVILMDEFLNE